MPKGPKLRKIPVRTCVACGVSRAKRELVRVVRLPDGQVVVDGSGRISGRGAYLCPDSHCIRLAKGKKRIEHSLEWQGEPLPESVWTDLEALVPERKGS